MYVCYILCVICCMLYMYIYVCMYIYNIYIYSENSSDKNHFDKQLLITILLLKIADLMKISHIFQVHPSVKLERDKLFGSIPLIVLMRKLTLLKFL